MKHFKIKYIMRHLVIICNKIILLLFVSIIQNNRNPTTPFLNSFECLRMIAFMTSCHDFIFPLQGRKPLLLLERQGREPEVSCNSLPETHMNYLARRKRLALPVSRMCFLDFLLCSVTTCHKVSYKALTVIVGFPPKQKHRKQLRN